MVERIKLRTIPLALTRSLMWRRFRTAFNISARRVSDERPHPHQHQFTSGQVRILLRATDSPSASLDGGNSALPPLPQVCGPCVQPTATIGFFAPHASYSTLLSPSIVAAYHHLRIIIAFFQPSEVFVSRLSPKLCVARARQPLLLRPCNCVHSIVFNLLYP
jgi:hypothetical protein